MMGWYGNTGWWNAGMLFMGVFWVLLIAVAVWGVLRLSRRPDDPARAPLESARQILDRRLACGEVDTEQYGEARRVLEGRSADDAHR